MEAVVIRPTKGWGRLKLDELWRFRELLFFFVWRDVKVRYKQTFFGAAWAVIQPVGLCLVFTVFIGGAGVTSGGDPYPIFSFTALVPWTLFSTSLTWASMSLVAGQNLVSKIYFPRLILPMAATVSHVIDFGIALVILFGMLFYYGYGIGIEALWLPAFTLLALVTALGVGVWLSAINARYRDVQHAMAFIVQIWLFASPVAISSKTIPAGIARTLYGLNPMVGVIDGFRWALLGGKNLPPGAVTIASAVGALLILVTGLMYFQKAEKTMADVI